MQTLFNNNFLNCLFVNSGLFHKSDHFTGRIPHHRLYERMPFFSPGQVFDKVIYEKKNGSFVDLSRAGARFISNSIFQCDDFIECALILGLKKTLNFNGIIKWNNIVNEKQNLYEIGIQFEKDSLMDLDFLELLFHRPMIKSLSY